MDQDHNRRSGDKMSIKIIWLGSIMGALISIAIVASYLGDTRYAKRDEVAEMKTDVAVIKEVVKRIEEKLP